MTARIIVTVLMLLGSAVFSQLSASTKSFYHVQWDGLEDVIHEPWRFIVVPNTSTVLDYDNNKDFNAMTVKWGFLPFQGLWSDDLQDYTNFGSHIDDLPANRDPSFREMAWRTNYINGLHFIMFGILALLPNDFTNWSDEAKNLSGAWDRWKENVKAGPVWDNDAGITN